MSWSWQDPLTALPLALLPLVTAYSLSHRFRYGAKYTAYYGLAMLVSLLVLPLLVWRPRNMLNCLIVAVPLKWLAHVIGVHFELRGEERMREERAAVVVANHQSSVDVLGMVHMWPVFHKMTVICKRGLLYAGSFGAMAWLVGLRFINRADSAQSRREMGQALQYIKEHKAKLWVFPEGTRNLRKEMLPFKKGAFHLAITGQIPILPVVFSSYRGFMNPVKRIFNPGNIIVTCLPAVPTEGLTLEDLPRLMEDVRSRMAEAIQETSAEVKHPQASLEEEATT